MSTLVVFEDEAHGAFEIATALRAVFDLRCGAETLLERIRARAACNDVCLVVRPEHLELGREMHPEASFTGPAAGEALFVNGRLLPQGGDLPRLTAGPAAGFLLFNADTLVAARTTGAETARVHSALASALAAPSTPSLRAVLARECAALPHIELGGEPERTRDGSVLVAHLWDLVRYNGRALCDDFRFGPGAGIDSGALVYPGVYLLQENAIRIGPGCRLKPGVVLDAEDGPITLDANVEVQPQVVLRGPLYVGPGCVLKAGAKIHEGTSFGPRCKIGGEVEESIVQGFSNKQHEGFLGHAYLGEWVNLGADTNNSDLKNNYSNVRTWESGRNVDTGMMFVGLLAGDHVKSAINTQFNTGTVVGLSSQIFGSGFPPKFVPPFSWGGATALETYTFDRALGTARTVMQRRKVELSAAYERALRRAFDRWEGAPRALLPEA